MVRDLTVVRRPSDMPNVISARTKKSRRRTILSMVIVIAAFASLRVAAGQLPQQTVTPAPSAAPSSPKSEASTISTKPPDIPVEQIVKKFGDRELEFKK